MALPTKPALVKAFGKTSFGFILTATTAAPTVAQMTAITGINLTCFAFGDQDFVTQETEKVTLPRLLCETQQYQANGPKTLTMADWSVSYDPQADDGADGRLAWEALLEGTAGYAWRRQGVAPDVAITAGDRVDLIPVEIGGGTPMQSSTDTNAVYTSMHAVSITGAPFWGATVVA